jgi:hypothetical protein
LINKSRIKKCGEKCAKMIAKMRFYLNEVVGKKLKFRQNC